MAGKRINVFHVKYKIVSTINPQISKYKPAHLTGLVLAKNQDEAIATGYEELKKGIDLEKHKIELKCVSVKKTIVDFLSQVVNN